MPTGVQAARGDGPYLFSLVVAILFWSTSFVGTKLAYETFPPLTLGVCRFIIALAAMAFLLVLRREFVLPAPRDLGTICLSGFLGITVYYAMENVGVSMTTASNSALIVSSTPALTIVLERLIYKTPIAPVRGVGVAMAIVGVYLISVSGAEEEASHALYGNLILAAAGIVWAFYNFATRKVVNKYPAVTVSFYQTAAGTLAFIPLAFLERSQWQEPTSQSLAMLVYLSLFCSIAAFLLYNYGLRKVAASTAVILLNLVPVFGVALSVTVLGEKLRAQQITGGIVVLAGVYLSVVWGRARSRD